MPRPHKSIQVFKSPFLEKLTHVHPLTPLMIWAPVSAWFFWRSFTVDQLNPYSVGMMTVFGFLSWTLFEYLLHRYVFHFAAEGPFQERLLFLMHGLHHEDPVDPTRLVMPPVVSIFLGAITFTVCRGIFGPFWADPFFASFVLGYLCYDYIHYSVHHFTPRTRMGRYLKQSHMLHHFAAPDTRWGVSSPLWDYVFGTLEAEKPVRHGS